MKNWLCFVLLLHRPSPTEAEASSVCVITISRLNYKMNIKNYFSCNGCDSQCFYLQELKFKRDKFQKLPFKHQEPEPGNPREQCFSNNNIKEDIQCKVLAVLPVL